MMGRRDFVQKSLGNKFSIDTEVQEAGATSAYRAHGLQDGYFGEGIRAVRYWTLEGDGVRATRV